MPVDQETRISIIVPVLNEATTLTAALSALQSLRAAGHEIIVVDGGSHDASMSLAETWADQVIRADRGRARQMNAGAAIAHHEILLFLHADTQLPHNADKLIIEALQKNTRHPSQWGHFDVQLSGRHFLLRIIERSMNWRSRFTSIVTGDQAIFICRDLFQRVSGFPDIPLMEDITLSRTLKRHGGPPVCLRQHVITSSRRWEQQGIVRTVLLMWWLRLAYALGANPQWLARAYKE